MDKKVLIVGQSVAIEVRDAIDAEDAWDFIDLVIVRDEDFEKACELAKATLPPGKRLVEVRGFNDCEPHLHPDGNCG